MGALLGALFWPIAILNIFGGIVSGIWLAVVGEWWALGYGLALMPIATIALSFALMPGMVLSLPVAYFMSKESRGWRLVALPFALLGSTYTGVLIIAWSLWVLNLYMRHAHPGSYVPLLLWSYGTATGPWTYMASKEGSDAHGSMIWATAAQIGYIVMMAMSLFASPTFGDLALAFGGVAVLALIVQYSAVGLMMAKARPDRAAARAQPEIDVTTHASTHERSPHRSYLGRHWRGELSLERSYWLNTFLLTTLLGVAIAGLPPLLDFTRHPTGFSLVVLALWIVLVVLTPWQLVGLWRSARNHVKNTGRYLWGRVVQVLVVFGVLNSVNVFLNTAIPQMRELTKIALGSDDMSGHRIRILRQGSELELSGAIGFGVTAEVKTHLDANASLRVVHLNSHGGRLAEAKKLRELIMAHNLITYSAEGCQSACVIAFMGGRQRILGPNAKLGFHRPSFPGLSSQELEALIRQERQFLVSIGVNSRYVDKALDTPSSSMWTPSPEELLRAGVITEISDGSTFAMSEARSWTDPDTIDKALRDVSLYRAMKEHDPEGYGHLLAQLGQSAKEGDTQMEMITKARMHVSKIVEHSLPHASQEAVIEIVRVMVAELRELSATSDDLCYGFLFGQGTPIDYSLHLSAEVREAELRAMAKIIETAATRPQPIPEESQVVKPLTGVLTKLRERIGGQAEVLNNPTAPAVDKGQVCRASLGLYTEILELPEATAAQVLRFMFANK